MEKEFNYTGEPAAGADVGRLLKKFPELLEQDAARPARQTSRGTERAAKPGREGRHHIPESIIQKAVAGAVSKARLTKRATGHTFRHALATNLLEDGCDIRRIQELLGY